MNKSIFFKFHFLLVISFTICSISLFGQTAQDIVYLKDGTVIHGSILIEGEVGESIFLVVPSEMQDTIVLTPNNVRNFVVRRKRKKLKKRSQDIFASKRIKGGSFGFFQTVYNKGQFPIYKDFGTNQYYFEVEEEVLAEVPKEKEKRRIFLKNLLPIVPKIINNSAYSKRLSSNKQFVNFLKNPFLRYPGRYFGIKTSYGFYDVENITGNVNALPYNPNDTKFKYTYMGASLYINKSISKKGKLVSRFNLGGRILESKGNFDKPNQKIAYSAKGYVGHSSIDVQHYFQLGNTFPYFFGGGTASILLKENSLIVAAIERGSNIIELDFNPQETFHNFDWSPIIGLGIEIPIKNQYYLFLESSVSSITDASNERVLTTEFSLGINLF